MSNEPVAPGLEPPPPPPAAPPPPSREEQVERVCPRFRPLFCFDESPRRLATSAAKLTLTRVDALIYRWAEERFDRAVAQQARAPDGLAGFRREVDALKRPLVLPLAVKLS